MIHDCLLTLQNMPIFGGIREDILCYLIENANIINLKKGEIFFSEKDKGNSMFILDFGKAVAYRTFDGQDYQLFELGLGDCFGEMELINPSDRSSTVICRENCRAIEISNKQLLELYRRDLEQFTIIQMNMAREVCRRLRLLEENLFSHQISDKQIINK